MVVTEAMAVQWLANFLWPLIRISGMISATPVLNADGLPMRVRALLALSLTWMLVPLLPNMPVVEIFSLEALLIGLQQLLIGILMGFILQLVFGAVVFGGQTIAIAMGLGFASMMDPVNGAQTPVVSQIFVVFSTLAFLLLNGHLVLFHIVAESFHTLPVAIDGITRNDLWALLKWSSRMFEAGLLMALPTLTAVLLMMVGLGVLTRAAPQLNIFSVGFPMGIIMGLMLMWVTLPNLIGNFQGFLDEAFLFMRELLSMTS